MEETAAVAPKRVVPHERPILFSDDMVRAILAGRKAQTRRPCRIQPELIDGLWHVLYPWGEGGHGIYETEEAMRAEYDRLMIARCPYGKPGDRLWVRETWALEDLPGDGERVIWKADHAAAWRSRLNDIFYLDTSYKPARWRPSIHLPRELCRLVLNVTAVGVERLQTITEPSAQAEGFAANEAGVARDRFESAWASMYGGESWDTNPWVWVVSFTVSQ